MHRVLILYSELAQYVLSCIEKLANSNCQVLLISWKVNNEAPFKFEFNDNIEQYFKQDLPKGALNELVHNFKPEAIVVSGWIDKEYTNICKTYKNQIPVIVNIDNKWHGTYKQCLATLISGLTFREWFTHIFVAGEPQAVYAKKLGFKEDKILLGCYSCDMKYFTQIYQETKAQKEATFPHVLIFLGRYYDFKGILELWDAFDEIQQSQPNNWQLWCIGKGDLVPNINYTHKIKHFGFVQPKELNQYMSKAGVFVLPSHKEPWGVVVHEFAAAGFPLLCSSEVGAASMFLQENQNGYTFKAKDKEALKASLLKVMSKSDEELFQMGQKSYELSHKLSPGTWAANVLSVLK